MPANALLSLRARKYGDEWDPVWAHLAEQYDYPGPLERDAAVDEIVEQLREKQGLVPARVAPTVYELIGDAHEIGLTQEHVERLAGIVERDDERRGKLLEHATENLRWERDTMRDWRAGPEEEEESVDRPPTLEVVKGAQPLSLHQWTQLLADDGLAITAPIADAPTCSSKTVQGGIDGEATTVFGRFEVEAGLMDLAYATDPMNWPKCSWFFISMNPQGPSTVLQPPDDVGNRAYTRDLEELVGVENLLTVRTPLTTRYFVGQDSLGMEFDLTPDAKGDGKIDVDHGYLLAEKHPTDPNKLIVTSQKTFSFVGLNDLPFSFLCEFGWVDMMRAMAQCRAPGGGTP